MINANKKDHLLRRKDKPIFASPFDRFATVNYKEDIDKILQANSCKFPIIKHSRISPIDHPRNQKICSKGQFNRYDNNNDNHQTERMNTKQTNQQSLRPIERNSSVSLIPSLGRLLFDKDGQSRLNRDYLVSYSLKKTEKQRQQIIVKSPNPELGAKVKNKKLSKGPILKQEQEYNLLCKLMKDLQNRMNRKDQAHHLSFAQKIVIQRKETQMSQMDTISPNSSNKAINIQQNRKDIRKKQSKNVSNNINPLNNIVTITKEQRQSKIISQKYQKSKEYIQPWCQQDLNFSLVLPLFDLK